MKIAHILTLGESAVFSPAVSCVFVFSIEGVVREKRKRTMNHCTVNQNEDFSFLRKGTSGCMICA